jgi:hypothetical protein
MSISANTASLPYTRIAELLEAVGVNARFAPHGKFWNVPYAQFRGGDIPGVVCAKQPVPIVDPHNPENSAFLQALENPNGFCSFDRMPADGPPFLTDAEYSVTLADGTVFSGAEILSALHAWFKNGAPEQEVPATGP